jgi:phage terminase large subunit-like protein
MSAPHWSRFVCNLATKSVESWLDHLLWADSLEAGAVIPDGAAVTIGVDVGLVHDSTAVVVCWKRDDGRMLLECRVWNPLETGKVRLEDVEQHLLELANRFDVKGVLYDPRYFDRTAEMLSDEGLLMVTMQQNSSDMGDAYQGFYIALAEDRLRHAGDPILTAHVMAAAAEETDRGWKIRKMRQSQRIDACVAAVMACWGAESLEPEPLIAWAFA